MQASERRGVVPEVDEDYQRVVRDGVTPRNGQNCTLSHEAKSESGLFDSVLTFGVGVPHGE